jgi:catechol 2,3-dioxygenase-like lactoylglutathione lyase family enzyme
MTLTRVLAWIGVAAACVAVAIAEAPPITGVEAIGVTVSDLDRSVEFYTQVLHFHKEWETELSGADVEHPRGVFGVRVRVARLRLGSEEIEFSEYLAPQGHPLPQDSRSNDLWFQHIAIVVRDIDEAYKCLPVTRSSFPAESKRATRGRRSFSLIGRTCNRSVSPRNTQALNVKEGKR